ncbi:MAG: argininosuccinate lyase [Candidatus Omnitrophica bacterium]|nr:argininosuccinate lyase [Candidatus Omnitrophota bacterium]
MAKKLWGGRFNKALAKDVLSFTSSINIDKTLAIYDCLGSIAHAKMLGKAKIIPAKDAKKIVKGLKSILTSLKKGTFKVDKGFEDIHSNIQYVLTKKIGKTAGRLHTARSRNDQVVTDTRMYCKDTIDALIRSITLLQKSVLGAAKKYVTLVIPGYTHLEHAQPVLFSHLLLAYIEMLERDKERLEDTRKRIDVLVLGSGALTGTTLPIDRNYVKKLLGFKYLSRNSIDAVSDRDFIVEFLGALSIISMHLSRIAEDMILYGTKEFDLIEIDERFCTGSSLMPQKKNPDVLELIRGKTSQIYGSLVSVLGMLKGLPLSYNRDLQLDKEPLFSSIETINEELKLLAGLFASIKINKKNAGKALKDETIFATDIAEYLVGKGIAFRDAHDITGKLVKYCEKHNKNISTLDIKELNKFSKCFKKDIFARLNPESSVRLKKSIGSTNPVFVKKQIKNWNKILKV